MRCLLNFSYYVFRDLIMRGYRFERNSNDFHDGMQTLYLSCERNCLVTEDQGLIRRVQKSSQSARVIRIGQLIAQ